MEDSSIVTFDDEFRVRVLDADKHAASAVLQESCATFDTTVDKLKEYSEKYIHVMEEVAKNIEAEKLRAIGLRNRVGAAREERELAAEETAVRKRELSKRQDALDQQAKSLRAVIDEQNAQLARLKGLSST